MPYAITSTCCNDASCVSVCPVNCIHPVPGEPGFASSDQLYIDPEVCIDCGACADACPVDAITTVDALRGADTVAAQVNAQYFQDHDVDQSWGAPHFPRSLPSDVGPLRIAVVGTGPAASYAAQSLLRSTEADLTIVDRLPVPGGLLRYGVAPDHPSTKQIAEGFAEVYRHSRVSLALNVDVGRDLTHEELAAHHSAVVYAVGAASDRLLDVPGEDLPGCVSATAFVAWYNGHPDAADLDVDLSGERAVVVGTGNVALDVARILLTDPEALARTDIADHALQALRASAVREVVLLGRRGPEHAAFTPGELLGLQATPGLRVVVEDVPGVRDAFAAARPGSKAGYLADLDVEPVDWSAPVPDGRRVVFRFLSSPLAFSSSGDGRVADVRTSRPDGAEEALPTGLVLRAIGYHGRPVAGLPFDAATGTVPNDRGRVVDPDSGAPLPGTYVVGWIKRGPSGGIGTNRRDAEETVDALLDDAAAHRLPVPTASGRAFERLVRRRQPDVVGRRAASAIDEAEREAGSRAGRPRVKLVTVADMVRAGRSRTNPVTRWLSG